ncbi:MAG: hypothetical protein ACE5H8_10675 [Alphaproteobacteria bacterium]
MNGSRVTADRIAALFLLGALAFNAPILMIFSGGPMIFGVPLLYVYLFGAWAVLIALMGLSARRTRDVEFGAPPPAPPDADEGR